MTDPVDSAERGDGDGVQQQDVPPFPVPPQQRPRLVPLEVSRIKLARELEHWDEQSDTYRHRGWVLLGHDLHDLWVDVGFLSTVQFGSMPLTVVAAAAHLDFTNYDLEPASLTFIDPATRQLRPPPWTGLQQGVTGEPVRALLSPHPLTGVPFLCAPGVWEFHSHHAHDDDWWLAELRGKGAGALAVICERIWDSFAKDLAIRIQFQFQLGRQHHEISDHPSAVSA